MPEISQHLYLLTGAVLFAVSFYALVVQTHLLRRIMALNVMGSGVFMVFLALADRTAGSIADPVPHAMVLTGIVVSVCGTGLALALADRVQAAMTLGESEDGQDRNSDTAGPEKESGE